MSEQETNNETNTTESAGAEVVDLELERVRRQISQAEAPPEMPGDDAAKETTAGPSHQAHQAFTVSELNVQSIAMMLQTGFGAVALIRGPHWALSQEEANQGAVPLAACADKYLGDVEIGPEWAAALAFTQIIGVRLVADFRLQQLRDEQVAKRAAGEAASAVETLQETA